MTAVKRSPYLLLIVIALLTGCGTLKGATCRSFMGDLSSILADSITSEIRKEPPQGAYGHPYSHAEWDRYWNHMIFYDWDVGPNDCQGTYRGPSGQTLIRQMIGRRREIGLPEINLEERNRDKSLQ